MHRRRTLSFEDTKFEEVYYIYILEKYIRWFSSVKTFNIVAIVSIVAQRIKLFLLEKYSIFKSIKRKLVEARRDR